MRPIEVSKINKEGSLRISRTGDDATTPILIQIESILSFIFESLTGIATLNGPDPQ